jgi:hypothetical protein
MFLNGFLHVLMIHGGIYFISMLLFFYNSLNQGVRIPPCKWGRVISGESGGTVQSIPLIDDADKLHIREDMRSIQVSCLSSQVPLITRRVMSPVNLRTHLIPPTCCPAFPLQQCCNPVSMVQRELSLESRQIPPLQDFHDEEGNVI